MVSSELLDAGCFPAADRSMGRPDPYEDGPVGGCERGQDEALTAEDVHDGGLGEVVGACRRGWWRRGRIRWRRGRRRFRWRRRRGRFRWGWFGCGHRWWRFGCGRRWWLVRLRARVPEVLGPAVASLPAEGRRGREAREPAARRPVPVPLRRRCRWSAARCRLRGAHSRWSAARCRLRGAPLEPPLRRRLPEGQALRRRLPEGQARRRLPEGQARRRRLLPRTRRKPRGSPWWL